MASVKFETKFQNPDKSPDGTYDFTYLGAPQNGLNVGDIVAPNDTWWPSSGSNGGFSCTIAAMHETPGFLMVTEDYLVASASIDTAVTGIETVERFYIDHTKLNKMLVTSKYNQESPTGRWSSSGYAIQEGVDPNILYPELRDNLNQLSDSSGNVPSQVQDAVVSEVYGNGVVFTPQTGDGGLQLGEFRRGVLVNTSSESTSLQFQEDLESKLFVASVNVGFKLSQLKSFNIVNLLTSAVDLFLHHEDLVSGEPERFDITERRVVGDLGVVGGSEFTHFNNTDFEYDYAINGLPFLTAARDQDPIERAFSPVRREQFDSAQVAGEQTLQTWWLRSQHTFTGGAGSKLFEPANNENVRTKFANSQGIDPWVDGQLRLLPEMVKKSWELSGNETSIGVLDVTGVHSQTYGESVVFTTGKDCWLDQGIDGDRYQILKESQIGYDVSMSKLETTSLIDVGQAVIGVSREGDSVLLDYVNLNDLVGSGWVRLENPSGFHTPGQAEPQAWWIKERLIVGDKNVLWEIPLTAEAQETITYQWEDAQFLYKHPNPEWEWTGCAASPDSILVSGHAGNKGSVLKFVIDPQSGLTPTLTDAVTVLEFPKGEIPFCMISYLGAYLGIGTNKGFRVAQIGGQGNLALGAIVFETQETGAVKYLTAKDRFIYASLENGMPDGSSGLVRVDLAGADENNRFPYANDVEIGYEGITGVTQLGNTGQLVVAGLGLWFESNDKLVETGWLETSQVLFGTLENKQFCYAEALADARGSGTGVLSTVIDGQVSSLVRYSGANANTPARLPSVPRVQLGLQLKLIRQERTGGSEPDSSPSVIGWTIRALPSIVRQELVKLPLMCYDNERDTHGLKREGDSWARYQALRGACARGELISYQNLQTGELATAVVEDLGFRQSSPPRGFDGFGGTINITLRLV